MDWTWIRSTGTFVVMCVTAAVSHWIAHVEQDFRFTILGFMSAVFGGMYYGLHVPNTMRYDKW